MVPKRLIAALVALFVCFSFSQAWAGDARNALVVGNSAYSFGPLANPTNDARDVARALEEAGFTVDLLLDADLERIEKAIVALNSRLAANGGVGLFFFAGHGVVFEGENYLLPVGTEIEGEADLVKNALSATKLVNAMTQTGSDLNIIILDACRDNPFTGKTSGLTRIESSASMFVSYSTSLGNVALDGAGRNSPYTKHLTLSLATPNLNLEETFKRTLKGVYQETKGKQTPWLSSSFFGDFVFRNNGDGAVTEEQTSANQGASAKRQASALRIPDATAKPPSLAGVYHNSGTNPDGSRYRGMLALEEKGDRYGFTWWIGNQVFRGEGELAGRMMVVEWNSTHPVVYDLLPNGVLDGEWADGSAKERLELFAPAKPGVVPRNGKYKVDGRNPDGSRYKGVLSVIGDGHDYELAWSIGRTSYSGRGVLENGVLVVDWGSSQPVIYAVGEDGTLSGLWESGKGSEIATLK
ncbi:MAG: caspase family protein [Nitratireductor sp.]